MKIPPICIDLSPSLVNKTALLDLPNAIFEILSKHTNVSTQYFGEKILPADIEKSKELILRKLSFVLKEPDFFIKNLPSRNESIFFLDPLYVLFSGVTNSDTVLILDCSTITNPEWHRPEVSNAYQHAFKIISKSNVNCLFISDHARNSFNFNLNKRYGPECTLPLFLPDKRVTEQEFSCKPEKYFLFVGSLEKRKNILGLYNSFIASNLSNKGYKLIIVGGDGFGKEDLPHYIFNDSSVIFAGYLDDGQINALYYKASGFLYLSYLEGFGVPLVEAMHHGIPIIASNTSAIPEVLGPKGVYVDPDDYLGAAKLLNQAASMSINQRLILSKHLRNRATEIFSKPRFANNLIKCIENIYG